MKNKQYRNGVVRLVGTCPKHGEYFMDAPDSPCPYHDAAPAKPTYYVIGPDEITDGRECDSITAAARGMVEFVLRYRGTGYYRTASHEMIDFLDLANHCTISTSPFPE